MKNRIIGFVMSVVLAACTGGNPYAGDNDNPSRVFFLDDKLGYAVGANGSLYVTKDGGKNWEEHPYTVEVNMTSEQSIDNIWFRNEKEVLILKEHKARIYNIETKELTTVLEDEGRGISIDTDEQGNFYAAFSSGNIYKSTSDAWSDWTLVCQTPVKLYRYDFYSSHIAALISEDGIYTTSDSGKNWSKVYAFPFLKEVDGWLFGSLPMEGIAFAGENRLHAVLLSHTHPVTVNLYMSKDGGKTWSLEELSLGYPHIKFRGKYGILYGSARARITTDGGDTYLGV
ncbi:MAG: hypothetical protein LBQ73_10730 [Tannerellaceae bacterium]|nr:hypothetical protein [Tannerellaceae bacterium]